MRMYYFLLLCFFMILSCSSNTGSNRTKIMYLYSSDKSKVVSVISNYSTNKRIIANGKHKTKPNSNFYELDLTNVTELGDEIGVCWKKDGWEIVSDKSEIIFSEIDTAKYVLRENFFKDKGIPNTKYYIRDNCFTVGLLNYSKIYPRENGFIERIK